MIDLRFGGKAGPRAGEPIDARVTVLRAEVGAWQSFGRSKVPLGRSALVRVDGTEVAGQCDVRVGPHVQP